MVLHYEKSKGLVRFLAGIVQITVEEFFFAISCHISNIHSKYMTLKWKGNKTKQKQKQLSLKTAHSSEAGVSSSVNQSDPWARFLGSGPRPSVLQKGL